MWIAFVPFKVHITFHAGQRLTVNVVDGEHAGFSDTVEYQAVAMREGIVVLSWQEHIGSTIVHVLDFAQDHTLTYVTPAKGGFVQLAGTLRASFTENRH
jgi:molybdenum cofactor biosynthesis MoaF-like protein